MSADPAKIPENLINGVAACRTGNWRLGHQLLTEVAQLEDSKSPFPGYFYSYFGVAMVRCEGRKRDGIELCRYSVDLAPRDPENRLNLARAYLMSRNRRQAVKQIKLGLRLSPQHRLLRDLQKEIGYRRRPFIPFLSRDFFLNQWVGRMTYTFEKQRRDRLEISQEDAEFERLAGDQPQNH